MTAPLQALTHDQLADAETILAPAWTAVHAGYDVQVTRAVRLMDEMFARDPKGDRDDVTARRMAVILLDRPAAGLGTPYRCSACGRTYHADPTPPDWAIAGSETWVCWECAVEPSPPSAPLAIEAAPKRKPRAPRKPAAAKAAGGTS